jgi:hypothetical protein
MRRRKLLSPEASATHAASASEASARRGDIVAGAKEGVDKNHKTRKTALSLRGRGAAGRAESRMLTSLWSLCNLAHMLEGRSQRSCAAGRSPGPQMHPRLR